ncbi:MAG: lipopolysaccharide core heptose(I) kinase RfaP [Exilibacterium sp.]
MKLILNDKLKHLWADKDVFAELQRLPGRVVRDKEGRQTMRVELAGDVYYRKLHTGVGWLEIIKNLLQGRLPVVGAANEWLAIRRLHELGVSTLNAVGYGCRGGNPATQQSFLITEELTGTVSLAQYAQVWGESRPPFALKKALIEKVAEITRIMHTDGINHRDLYICHFLLDISQGDTSLRPENIRLFLVDLHRAQMRSRVPRRWLIKDLASIHFSSLGIGLTSRDYLRFLRVYYRQPLRQLLPERECFFKRIARRSRRLYLRDLRKGYIREDGRPA